MGAGISTWMAPELRAALAETCLALADIAGGLTAGQERLPSSCPGWDVHDQVAHVSGLEATLAGEPLPEHEPPAAGHVKSPAGLYMERLVDWRRSWPLARLVTELREVTARRSVQLAELGDDGARLVPGLFGGEAPLARVLGIRVFDVYAHEQDVRRAIGRPGHLDGPVAAIVRDRIATGLAFAWAKPAAGQRIRLVVDDWTYGLDLTGERSHVDDGAQAAALTFTVGFGELLPLACGRSDARPGAVSVQGDPELAALLLAGAGFTP
jgi:uncharacterized protein (TIGR03083 family)